MARPTYHEWLHAYWGESSKSFRPGLLRAIGGQCLFCWRLRRSPGSDKAPRLVRRWLVGGQDYFLVPLLSNRPPAPAAGSPATAGKLLPLLGASYRLEQDGSTELIRHPGQLNLQHRPLQPAVMAALKPCRVCLLRMSTTWGLS